MLKLQTEHPQSEQLAACMGRFTDMQTAPPHKYIQRPNSGVQETLYQADKAQIRVWIVLERFWMLYNSSNFGFGEAQSALCIVIRGATICGTCERPTCISANEPLLLAPHGSTEEGLPETCLAHLVNDLRLSGALIDITDGPLGRLQRFGCSTKPQVKRRNSIDAPLLCTSPSGAALARAASEQGWAGDRISYFCCISIPVKLSSSH